MSINVDEFILLRIKKCFPFFPKDVSQSRSWKEKLDEREMKLPPNVFFRNLKNNNKRTFDFYKKL
jgi:hypothetical protein